MFRQTRQFSCVVENVAGFFFVPDGFELQFPCEARLDMAVLLASFWLSITIQ
jgi:hypothetical protein